MRCSRGEIADVEPQFERLRAKAVARVRDFLLAQVAALRRPKTNVQILQQNTLLRFRFYNQFLRANAPEARLE